MIFFSRFSGDCRNFSRKMKRRSNETSSANQTDEEYEDCLFVLNRRTKVAVEFVPILLKSATVSHKSCFWQQEIPWILKRIFDVEVNF